MEQHDKSFIISCKTGDVGATKSNLQEILPETLFAIGLRNAIICGHVAIVKLLMEHLGNRQSSFFYEQQNNWETGFFNDYNPIHLAVEYQQIDMVQYLLEDTTFGKKQWMNEGNCIRPTPLEVAMRADPINTDIVMLLLQNGAEYTSTLAMLSHDNTSSLENERIASLEQLIVLEQLIKEMNTASNIKG